MANSSSQKPLELSVANLGPIVKGEIDLRPMTVFVGPSNTGKSYLAILIYALHRFFNRGFRDGQYWRHRAMFRTPRRRRNDLRLESMSDREISDFVKCARNLAESVSHGGQSDKNGIQLPETVASLVRKEISEYLGELSEAIHRDILRSFGVADASGLIRHRSRGGLKVTTTQRVSGDIDSTDPISHTFTTKTANTKPQSSIPETFPLYIDEVDDEPSMFFDLAMEFRFELQERNDEDKRLAVANLIGGLSDLVVPNTVGPLNRTAYYLPADRTGIMHAHLVAVASGLERLTDTGLRQNAPLPELSGVLVDFLTQLMRLGRYPGATAPGRELATRLERKILGGDIQIEESVIGYPEFYYRPDGWKRPLPLMNTSSMVSELAPVVLYLRHIVHPGEVLIIEEPESHLHPAMQVEFIRHLAAAVRSGVRIMITTHSEWVLDELANLVRLFGLSDRSRKGIPSADFALNPSDVGVWLFEPDRRLRGSVVREIPFEEEIGGFRSGFDEVAMATYNDYAQISNRLGGSE